jgi:hypothetical protein
MKKILNWLLKCKSSDDDKLIRLTVYTYHPDHKIWYRFRTHERICWDGQVITMMMGSISEFSDPALGWEYDFSVENENLNQAVETIKKYIFEHPVKSKS